MPIRELRWADFEPLTRAYWALYDEVLEDPEVGIGLLPARPTLGEEAEWFAAMYRRVQDGTDVARVAEEGGAAVGLCDVRRRGPQREARHIGTLGISIAKEWRGRGIGRALMSAVLAECRGRFEIVELTVFATNVRAQRLYESLGFRTWGTQPRAIRRGERYIDSIHMQLLLPTDASTPGLDPRSGR